MHAASHAQTAAARRRQGAVSRDLGRRAAWLPAAALAALHALLLVVPAAHGDRGGARGAAFASSARPDRGPAARRGGSLLCARVRPGLYAACAGKGMGVVGLRADVSQQIDEFRQGSAGVVRKDQGGASAQQRAARRTLPMGSLQEQREQLNAAELEREAWYDMMRRKVRASSYQNGIQDIRRLFSQFDADKNGALDREEYRTLLMRMGMRSFGITDDDLRILFIEMGANGRGMEVKARQFFQWFAPNSQGSTTAAAPAQAEPEELDMSKKIASELSDLKAAFRATAAQLELPASARSGWTYGESMWWDEGPEMRVLKSIGAVPVADEGRAGDAVGAGRSDEEDDEGVQALVAAVEPWADTSTANLHASVYFLANEIGLSHSQVRSLALVTPGVFAQDVDQQLRPRFDDLRGIGVPVSKIAKLLTAAPHLLEADGWQSCQEAMNALQALGIPWERLGACIVRHPRVLDLDEDAMDGAVGFLVGACRVPRDKVHKIIEVMPSLLSHSVEDNLRPKMVFLVEDLGIAPERVGALLLKFPQLLGLSVEGNLRPTVKYLTDDLGVAHEEIGRILVSAPQLLGLSVKTNLKDKVRYLTEELGIPRSRLGQVVAKCATLLTLNVDKNLRPKVEFLVNEAGFSLDDIIKAPNVLTYSLARMRQRHRFLTDKGLRIGLASMVSYSTADFQKRFDRDGDLL